MTNTNRPLIIDTPEGIEFASILALRSALSLKVNHNLQVIRGSLVKITNHKFGTTFRTNVQCFAYLNEVLADFDARGEG